VTGGASSTTNYQNVLKKRDGGRTSKNLLASRQSEGGEETQVIKKSHLKGRIKQKSSPKGIQGSVKRGKKPACPVSTLWVRGKTKN